MSQGGTPKVAMATDALLGPPAGIRRYVSEMAHRLSGLVEPVQPHLPKRRIRGLRLAWEQTILPARTRKRLLWSPSGTGPISKSHQVVTMHDLAAIDHPEWTNPTIARWQRILYPKLLRSVRHIIAISDFTKGRICDQFTIPPSKVTVVHHGVSEHLYPRPQSEQDAARNALNLGNQRFALALGTLEPRKNLTRLIQAWDTISGQHPDVILVIAGAAGSEKYFGTGGVPRIKTTAKLLGFIPEQLLAPLYSAAELVAYPSLYEGFGWPPLEALACGAPVLASNTTAMPEVLGNAALLVNPFDPREIARGIDLILSSRGLAAELRGLGPERAACFSWQATEECTSHLLRRFN